ncbi:hypothetical protein G210_2989 [Candida maltosa Xu316]|uniref:Cyclin-like domain-containing protein n=1 Tax=Candida maltosa (strain Xu316) TaxID=1245528 RepID=M3J459_CANMX|nr:hypothetical protein G210_2989 [Candida maltosa Xu316]
MSIRLKILPFVFFKAIKIFDRYCSKRIVLLDQSQLIITTCLWIASKVTGGNNHFVNINNLDKIGANNFKTINDLGYGSGGKFIGPTERFRLPKLNELVKLCGTKCKYDQGMFKQMEIHILNTLEWSLNDPTIEEFIINSHEFNVDCHNSNNNNSLGLNHPSDTYEFFKIKQYLSYVSLYSHELIDINIIELGQVIMDLINEVFKLSPNDKNYQTILNCDSNHPIKFDLSRYKYIKKSLIKSIFNSSDFMMKIFNSKGPQYLYQQINLQYKINHPPPSTASNTPTTANHHPSTCTTTTNNNNNPIAFTNTTSVTNNTTHNSRSSSVSSDSSSTITNTPSTTPPPLVNTPLSNISTPPNHIHSTKKRSKSSSASPSLTFKYLHHHNHQPSIPPPQFHNSSNNNYQLVTPPHSAKNNTHHQIHNYIPPPHQLSSSSSCSTSSSSASSFSSSSSNANFFNSPNIQPPHSRFTPGGGINTGNSSNNGSARRYAFDATSINSKMTANTIATSSSSIFSNNTTFESNNDLLESTTTSNLVSKRYNSTLNPNNNTPLTDTESPVYTKTRLCKNILK